MLDAWTNTAAVLDQAGTYAITLSTWNGDLPDDVIRIDVPTAMAWSIARTVLSGKADLPNVHAVQAKMLLRPLSTYLGRRDVSAPEGEVSERERLRSHRQGSFSGSRHVL